MLNRVKNRVWEIQDKIIIKGHGKATGICLIKIIIRGNERRINENMGMKTRRLMIFNGHIPKC